ncbi:MAG: PAS domain S-box protein, partial [Deltaproteobacteria bacterium]|nr:PAS domain S-box protein [Deltaproteobacteria bacterium]
MKEKKTTQKSQKAVSKKLNRGEVSSARKQINRTIWENFIGGLYIIQKGSFTAVNENAASFAGYEIEEMIGLKTDSIVHPEDRIMVKQNAIDMLQGERTSPHLFRIITKQGDIRWIMETVTPISYEKKPAILGNFMDVTERMLAQEALRESEQRLADIIDFLPDPTMAVDLEGKLIVWNRGMEEMMGVKAKDILGKGSYEHAFHFYGKRIPMLVDLVLDPGSI